MRRRTRTRRRNGFGHALSGAVVLVFASAAAEPSLTLPPLPALSPPPPSSVPLPEAPPPTLGPGDVGRLWALTRAAMIPCDESVALARRQADADNAVPAATLEAVQMRCASAVADIGMMEPPPAAGPRIRARLIEARDACQRSMAEKQLAIEAIDRLLGTGAVEAYAETRLRADAIDRSSLACQTSFAAAAEAAGVPLPGLDAIV